MGTMGVQLLSEFILMVLNKQLSNVPELSNIPASHVTST